MEGDSDPGERDDDERPTHVEGSGPYRDPTTLALGTDIAGYVIDGELGQGGMGVVYSATHRVIGKRAAIKVLRSEVSRSPVTVERFIQEARAVNKIGHPNIIDIFAFGTLPDGRAYHVMDLLVGESLRKRLRRGRLPPSEAAHVIEEVASALTAAHEQGYVHRDLKPDNVYLSAKDGDWPDVKLLDFGLAKLMPEAGVAAFTTKTGVMLGTPEYMSPEQARGVGVDHRTDIYALGIVMFEILAGRRPFASTDDQFAMLRAHAEEAPPSLVSVLPDLPDEMVQLVDAMLAKDPAARPSLAAVRTVIKRLRKQSLQTIETEPARPVLVHGLLATKPGVPPVEVRTKQPSTPPLSVPTGSSGPPASTIGVTKFGVPPPPKQVVARPVAARRPPRAASRTWLILGALLAIAAGVALAIILVGT